jgi:DNA-binding transcriptional ArsR family regulator
VEKFDAGQRLREVQEVFAALAHPTRRHILLVVKFRGGAMTAGEIAARFSCSWPTTTRHLRVLESAGLLSHEKEGRTRLYRINNDKLDRAREWLRWFEASGSGPESSSAKEESQ